MEPEEEAYALISEIMPILAGHNPGVQGCVLADLVAIHFAGHVAIDDAGDEERTLTATRELRQKLLTEFMMTVERLLPINAARMGAPHDPILDMDEGMMRS